MINRINFVGKIPEKHKGILVGELRHFVYSRFKGKQNWIIKRKIGENYYTLSYNQGVGRIIGSKQEKTPQQKTEKQYSGLLGVFGLHSPFYFFTVRLGQETRLYLVPNANVVVPYAFSIFGESAYQSKIEKLKDGNLQYIFDDIEKKEYIQALRNEFYTIEHRGLKWEGILSKAFFRKFSKETYYITDSQLVSSTEVSNATQFDSVHGLATLSNHFTYTYAVVKEEENDKYVFMYGDFKSSYETLFYYHAVRRLSLLRIQSEKYIRVIRDNLYNIVGWIPEKGHPFLENQTASLESALYVLVNVDIREDDNSNLDLQYKSTRRTTHSLVLDFFKRNSTYIIDTGDSSYDQWGLTGRERVYSKICQENDAYVLEHQYFLQEPGDTPRKSTEVIYSPNLAYDRFAGFDIAVDDSSETFGIMWSKSKVYKSSKADVNTLCWYNNDGSQDNSFCADCRNAYIRSARISPECSSCYGNFTYWDGESVWAGGWNMVRKETMETFKEYYLQTPLGHRKKIAECKLGNGYDGISFEYGYIPQSGTYVFTYSWSKERVISRLARAGMNISPIIFAFRDTPSIKFYDISNSAIGNVFQRLFTYWYIIREAKTEEIVQFVFGYNLLSFKTDDPKNITPQTPINFEDSIAKEFVCSKIDTPPQVKWSVDKEGVGGDMNRFTGEPYFFYITAIHPFWQSPPLEIQIISDDLSVPNGGINFEITIPKGAMGYNIFVPNIDANHESLYSKDDLFSTSGHYKIIKTKYLDTSNGEYTDTINFKTYAAHKLTGQVTGIKQGIIINETYYDPFFVLNPDKETMDFSEINFYTDI